jgi:hypothetical protein
MRRRSHSSDAPPKHRVQYCAEQPVKQADPIEGPWNWDDPQNHDRVDEMQITRSVRSPRIRNEDPLHGIHLRERCLESSVWRTNRKQTPSPSRSSRRNAPAQAMTGCESDRTVPRPECRSAVDRIVWRVDQNLTAVSDDEQSRRMALLSPKCRNARWLRSARRVWAGIRWPMP